MAKKETPTFYIFHGDDIFAMEEDVSGMLAKMGDPTTADLNTARFDGRSASVADVFNAACAMPFLSDKRLVIVDGWLAWLARSGAGKTGKDTLQSIAEQVVDLPDFARMVFLERSSIKDTNPVMKAARTDKRGYVKTFRQPKNIPSWIQSRAAHYGCEIEGPAMQALHAVTDGDMVRLDGEIFKLASYVEPGQPITERDVAALTPYVPEQSVFDMVDALGRRDGRTASRLLHKLLQGDDDKNGAMSLFAMIVRQFRLMIQARAYLEAGKGRGAALAKVLGIHSYPAGKIEQQCRNFSLEDLETIYRRLLDIDRRVKTGKIDPVLALDMFVAALSNTPD